MSYGPRLRRLLVGFQPRLEHLYLLEPFQIGQVIARIGLERLAALVLYDPTLRRVLELKEPAITEPLLDVLNQITLSDEPPEDLLWDIADMLVYAAEPALYDAAMPAPPAETLRTLLGRSGGVLADVGAGTGRLAFRVSSGFQTVYAVEPVGALRRFVRRQRDHLGLTNVHVLDGFLHELPFPDDALDVLITRSAMGWHLAAELDEIDRVLKPGGRAVHLTGIGMHTDGGGLHAALTTRGYGLEAYQEGRSPCRAYTLDRPSLTT